jgi:hypothetical protein
VADGPSQDGDPTDATLIESVATTIQSPGTDTYITIPFASNHTINGIYFLGYGSQRVSSAEFPLTRRQLGLQHPAANGLARPQRRRTGLSFFTRLQLDSAGAARSNIRLPAQGAFSGAYHSAFAIRANIVSGAQPIGTPECFGNTLLSARAARPAAAAFPTPAPPATAAGTPRSRPAPILSATGNRRGQRHDTVSLTCSDMTGPGIVLPVQWPDRPDHQLQRREPVRRVGHHPHGRRVPDGGVASYPGGLTPNPIHIAGAPVLLSGSPTAPTKHYQCWYRATSPPASATR